MLSWWRKQNSQGIKQKDPTERQSLPNIDFNGRISGRANIEMAMSPSRLKVPSTRTARPRIILSGFALP